MRAGAAAPAPWPCLCWLPALAMLGKEEAQGLPLV